MSDNLRILIVDDEPGFAATLKNILDEEGYSTAVASAAQDALSACAEKAFDLALVDVRLPDISGVALIERLAELSPLMEYIIVTGHASLDTAIEAVGQKRIVGYETKPLDMPRLLSLVRQVAERRGAEEKLRESEERYRRLVESLHEGIWAIDKDANTTFVNDRMAEMLGYTPEEMLGKHLFAFMDERGVELAQRLLERRQQGVSERHDFEFVRKDGRRLYASLATSPILDDEGKHAGAIASVQDITDLKRAEEALAASERRYRLVVENARDVIWTTDMNLQFTYMSPSVKYLRGFTADQVIGQSLEEIFTPSSVEVARMAFLAELAKEASDGHDPWRSRTLEVEHTCKDGSTVWAEMKMTFLRDPEGRPAGILGVSRDITERKRAQGVVRESEGRLAALIENAPDAIYMTDPSGNFTGGNRRAEELLGYRREELLGRNLLEAGVLPADYLSGAWASLQEYAGGSRLVPEEFEVLRKDGSRVSVEVTSIPVALNGKVEIIGIARDITRRRRMEHELEQSLESLRTMLDQTVDSLAWAVEMRDPYTSGHQRRVALLAAAIARELGLSEVQVEGVRMAGLIHDIGKVSIPAEILSKPCRLTKAEFELVKDHPRVGRDILKRIDFPWPVAEMVHQHHERMDGTGYPSGLSADQILLEAKILAVADVVEAMSSHRPYRAALGVDTAMEEILKYRDVLYDAKVVDACLLLLSEGRFKFE